MKLAPRTYRIEWDLHAWVGVLASLVGFVIFFFGVFALFRDDLVLWQDPALARHDAGATLPVAALLQVLEAHGQVGAGSTVAFVPHDGLAAVSTYLTDADGSSRTLTVDPFAATIGQPRTDLAEQLYQLHFLGQLPGGMQLSGVVAVALLVALVTGLLVHLEHVWSSWRFRPELGLRRASADAHTVLGVLGLPFTLVLCLSGAMLCLSGLLGSAVATSSYDGDLARVQQLHGYPSIDRTPTGTPAEALAPARLIELAATQLDQRRAPSYLELAALGDAHATARVYFPARPLHGASWVVLDAVDGTVLAGSHADLAPASAFSELLYALHFADFGGLPLRVLYALLALAMCAVILTGNLLWLERRDRARRRLGNRVLERLSLGVAGGAIVATAGALLANRVLLSRWSECELPVLLATWLLALVAVAASSRGTRMNARALLAVAAAGFAATVVIDLCTPAAEPFGALADGIAGPAVVDALLLTLAIGCVAGSRALRPREEPRC